MIAADLLTDATIARLRAAWAREPNLRAAPLLDEDAARALLAAAEAQPHLVSRPEAPPLEFQYWKWLGVPEPDCDHVLCRFGRLLHGEVAAWASAVTGLALVPAPDRQLATTLWTKGSYLDAHDDRGRDRAVAYVLGLTPGAWDAAEGGWLEFLGGPDGPVLERRPPGWNTLDLFDVRRPGRWHRVPILREHRARRTIAGWFHLAP